MVGGIPRYVPRSVMAIFFLLWMEVCCFCRVGFHSVPGRFARHLCGPGFPGMFPGGWRGPWMDVDGFTLWEDGG